MGIGQHICGLGLCFKERKKRRKRQGKEGGEERNLLARSFFVNCSASVKTRDEMSYRTDLMFIFFPVRKGKLDKLDKCCLFLMMKDKKHDQ